MFFLYFLIWIIFNGQFTPEIAAFGAVIAGAVYWFSCKYMGWSPKRDLWLWKRAGRILAYVGLLLWEILKANAAALRITLSYKKEPDPVLVRFRTKLKTNALRVLLANSITLTPGTITVLLEGDELTVHCLDASLSEGLEDSSFERALLRIEADSPAKEAGTAGSESGGHSWEKRRKESMAKDGTTGESAAKGGTK